MDVSIIIVSWRVKELLKKCLSSIFKGAINLSFEVFVVDNDSGDGTVEMIQNIYPQVKLICNHRNLGFAKANNQAIKLSKGKFILLLNPDTEIIDDAIAKSYNYLVNHLNTGVLGCKMKNPDGSRQDSVRQFPSFTAIFLIMLKLHYLLPNSTALQKYNCKNFDYQKKQTVDQVMGAYFFIRAELIKKIGLLDEHFFIWFEEVDYCHRVKKAGYEIVYLPDCQIVHHFAQSFNQVMGVKKQELFNRSILYYFRKHLPLWQYLILLIIYPFSLIIAVFTEFVRLKR